MTSFIIDISMAKLVKTTSMINSLPKSEMQIKLYFYYKNGQFFLLMNAYSRRIVEYGLTVGEMKSASQLQIPAEIFHVHFMLILSRKA